MRTHDPKCVLVPEHDGVCFTGTPSQGFPSDERPTRPSSPQAIRRSSTGMPAVTADALMREHEYQALRGRVAELESERADLLGRIERLETAVVARKTEIQTLNQRVGRVERHAGSNR